MGQEVKRIHLMDELRGLGIFCMVFFHAFYDMTYIFHIPFGHVLLDFFTPWQPFFAGMFILLSGIACNLSRSNAKRGGLLLLVSLGLTLVTVFVTPGQEIYFGILHMLAISMLAYALFRPVLEKVPTFVGVIVFFLLFAFTYGVSDRYVGFLGIWRIPLPETLYQTSFLFPLGFPAAGFHSSDYFPLLPWIFLFISGSFLGRYARQNRFPEWSYQPRCKFFRFIGKHSLVIYLVHQPVLYGLFTVIEWLL